MAFVVEGVQYHHYCSQEASSQALLNMSAQFPSRECGHLCKDLCYEEICSVEIDE